MRDMINLPRQCKRSRRWTMRPFFKLASNTGGAAAVEFALISVPFAALMVAILQTSLTFFAQQNLETAAEKSVRTLMTGKMQSEKRTQQEFKLLLCSELPDFMKCNNVMIDVQTAASFAAASTTMPQLTFDSNGMITNQWAYSPGGPGSINIVRVMYIWDVESGPLGFDLSNMSTRKRLLYATSVFKAEPFL